MQAVSWLLVLVTFSGCDLLPTKLVPGPSSDAATQPDLAVHRDLGVPPDLSGQKNCPDPDGRQTCSGATPICDLASGLCVACVTESDCKNPSGQVCMANQCVPCTTDDQCISKVCGSGLCVP